MSLKCQKCGFEAPEAELREYHRLIVWRGWLGWDCPRCLTFNRVKKA